MISSIVRSTTLPPEERPGWRRRSVLISPCTVSSNSYLNQIKQASVCSCNHFRVTKHNAAIPTPHQHQHHVQPLRFHFSHDELVVSDPSTAVKMWVESPKGKIKEGDSVELHCQDNGNPPSSLIAIKHIQVRDWKWSIRDGRSACSRVDLIVFSQSGASWDEDMVMLHKVRRHDSGLYECISTDTDSFKEVSGNMTLSVNCKDSTLLWGILKVRRPLILTSRWARRSGICCGGAERSCLCGSRTRAESHVQRPLFPVHTHGLAQGHSSSIHTQKQTLYQQ